MKMPGINGVETIQRARELRPTLPCFLLTGYVSERDELAGRRSFTLVRSPIGGPALAARLQAALSGVYIGRRLAKLLSAEDVADREPRRTRLRRVSAAVPRCTRPAPRWSGGGGAKRQRLRKIWSS